MQQFKNETMLNELKKQFKPELLNRIDEIIVFNNLSIDNISKIGKIFINDIKKKLSDKGIDLEIEESFLMLLAKKSQYEKYGARDLKRIIINEIENPLTDILLEDSKGLIKKIYIDEHGIKVIKKECNDLCLLN